MNQFIENSQITLKRNFDSGIQNINMTISSDLITNYETGSPVDIAHPFQVIQDSTGEPVIISQSTDNRLYIIMRGDSLTGWIQYDITPNYTEKKSGYLNAYEVFQSKNGLITFACAVKENDEGSSSKMYITKQLSNDMTETNWQDFSSYWYERPFDNAVVDMTNIYMGESDDSQYSIAVVSILEDGLGRYYQLNTNLQTTEWIWKKCTLPENAKNFIALRIGQQRGHAGIYALYDTSDGRTLEFTSFPIEKYGGKTFSVFFNPPVGKNLNTFDVLDLDTKSDSVFAAGDDIYLFKNGDTKPTVTIANRLQNHTFERILVRGDNSQILIWIVSNDGQLSMTQSLCKNHEQWQPLLIIDNNIREIGALRSKYFKANQLFTVDDNNRLNFMWQDPNTTHWKDREIPLNDLDKIIHISCYTTHINLEDKQNKYPVDDIILKLSSSQMTYVKVNGKTHILSGNTDDTINITPDKSGNVTLINNVSTISTPIFYLGDELSDTIIEIDPSSKAQNLLGTIKNGADLKNVQLQDGTKLIKESIDQKDLDSVAKSINQMMQISTEHRLAKGSINVNSLKCHTAVIRKKHLASKNLNQNQSYLWGVHFENGQYNYFEGNSAIENVVNPYLIPSSVNSRYMNSSPTKLMSYNGIDIGHAIESLAGDILKALEKGLEKVSGFIVHLIDGIYEFVVELGGKLVKFALDCIETVTSVINWILTKIKVTFEDLIKWLGFLFGWDDIIRTKKIMVNVINQFLDYGVSNIDNLNHIVDNFFENMENSIEHWGKHLEPVYNKNMQSIGKEKSSKGSNVKDFINSAPGNFTAYHIVHSGALSHEPVIGYNNSDNSLENFFKTEIYPLVNKIEDLSLTFSTDIYDIFTSNNLTVGKAFEKLGKDVLKSVLELLRTVVDGFLKIVEEAINSLKKAINAKAHIPILSALYKSISGDDDISLLDVVALMLSIPATTMFRVIAGTSPYPNGDTKNLETMDYNELIKLLKNGEFQSNISLTSKDSLDAASKLYKEIGSCIFMGAESISLMLRFFKSGSSDSLPLLPWVNLGLSISKFGSTYPVGVEGAIQVLSIFSWGLSGTGLLGSLLVSIAGSGNPMIGSANAAWDIFLSLASIIIGGGIFIEQMVMSPSVDQIAADIAVLAERISRGIGSILTDCGTIDPEKESGIVLVMMSLFLSGFALLIRFGCTEELLRT